jgi:hypothetical protein
VAGTAEQRAPDRAGISLALAAYESKFGNWDRRASVRTQPRRVLADGSIVDGDGPAVLFFPPELVPAAGHPLVSRRGGDTAHRLLVQSLYQYLHFTEVLEQVSVMPVTMSISLGRSGVEVPAAMRADALAITTDEAWHAQFSADFADQVRTASRVAGSPPVPPRFVRRLAEVRQSVPAESRRLVDLFFAVVSETLISTILSDIPRDERLPPALRALVADHAADEGRHHAYFRSFLRVLWPQLHPRERRLVGPRVPDLIRAFLEPDLAAVAAALGTAGLPPVEVRRVVAESYPPAATAGRVAVAAAATVRGFQEVGALDDPATREAFAAHRLTA